MTRSHSFTGSSWFFIVGILFISFNLRPAITGIGPLVPYIKEDLGLSNTMAGFLTTLPLLTFATFSLVSARIGRRLGLAPAIGWALVIIFVGTLLRYLPDPFWLFLGTGLTGVGIVICNVLLIPLIKKREPNRIGLLTSLYTTGMALFAAVASGLAAPLAEFKGLGWRGSLVAWALLVLIGILLWWPQMQRKEGQQPRGEALPAGVSVWKSPLAWQVSMVLGVQSLLFFTLVSWFPDMLVARGYSTAKAGLLLSVMQLIGLAGSFLAPIFAVKFRQQQGAVSLVSAGYLIGFSLLFIENTAVLYACMVILGTSMGSSISLAYTMIGLRTEDEQTTGALSGMAQSAGYYLAALGPVCFGLVFDAFGNWDHLLYLMLACTVLFWLFGLQAGKATTVEAKARAQAEKVS